MKRYRAIKDFLFCLEENDIVVFSGENISREAYQYDRKGYFYVLDSYGVGPSLALGMAMFTDKRVFVIDGDGGFMMELGTAAQMAVSRCQNIFYVVLDNGCYQSAGGHPTIFREISAVKGFIFNLGFTVYEFTPYFTNKKSISNMCKMVKNMKGPAMIRIKVDKGHKKDIENVNISKNELKKRITSFINNKELGTSLFKPPMLQV